MKTLLAVDGSPYTERMVNYLIQHPKLLACASSITVLTVLPEMPYRSQSAMGQEGVKEYRRSAAQAILDPVMETLQPYYADLAPLWRIGFPSQEIANHARDEGFDLIVMGSHGHSALANIVMGSVSTKVLARCKVPVLIIR